MVAVLQQRNRDPKSTLAEGKKLKNSLLLDLVSFDSLTQQSLAAMRQQTSASLGLDCQLHLVRGMRADGTSLPMAIVCARRVIIAAYELTPYQGRVRCNRVCDAVVQGMIDYFGGFPGVTERQLVPLEGNRFAGSKVLPSGSSPDELLEFC